MPILILPLRRLLGWLTVLLVSLTLAGGVLAQEGDPGGRDGPAPGGERPGGEQPRGGERGGDGSGADGRSGDGRGETPRGETGRTPPPLVPGRVPARPGNLNYERIVDFDSRIVVEKSGAVTVTEKIRVVVAGRIFKRGIYRDLPLKYRDRLGRRVTVGFEILEILRDGKEDGWHTKSRSNGIRIYVGRKSHFLRRGVYTYTIKYRVTRVLGFFGQYDEIYWNVTGNGWGIAIERARATVVLPQGTQVRQSAAYTGYLGARGRAFTKRATPGGGMVFETTQQLRARQGLSIAVGFTKGVVTPPSGQQKFFWFLADNGSSIAGLFALIVLLIYYGVAWVRVGKDPARGTIIPLYEPPKGISPAAARYIRRMGFDNKAFAAAVVNMAVKGYITINEDKKKKFTLERLTKDKGKLTKGESDVAGKLFKSKNKIRLVQSNHSKIRGAISALKSYLSLEFEKAHFLTNGGYFWAGVGLMALGVLGIVLAAEDIGTAFFISLWLSIWTIGVFFLGYQAVNAWRTRSYFMAVLMTVFFVPFFFGEVAGIWAMSEILDWFAVLALVGMGTINAVFWHLMKAPTRMGRKVMDDLEGFRMYLAVAEKDRMNLMNPPKETPELFEKFLPYALALDVEQKWSERFADVLKKAKMADGTPYHPYWYHGTGWTALGATGLATGLGGAFSSAISSSSTAPGSSSGSGGGGFSGGGGGGGGGGGW